jgi:hypothetical protein
VTYHGKHAKEKPVSVLLDGTANKFLVAVVGAISTSLSVYYGTTKWEPMVLAVITAVMTYVIPNISKPDTTK